MENFGDIYNTIWAIVVICGSTAVLFFKKEFLKLNENAFLNLYKKTNLAIFERASKEFTRPFMDILVSVLGLAFLAIGILTLLGFSI